MHILTIEGMTCDACKQAVSNAVATAAPGLTFEVDLQRKQVRFRALPAERQTEIRNAIRAAGFGVLEGESP